MWHDGSRRHCRGNDNLDGPIAAAFRQTSAEPLELSYGNRDDNRAMLHPISNMQIIDPQSE